MRATGLWWILASLAIGTVDAHAFVLGDIEQQLVNVTFADLVGAILDPVTGRPVDGAALDASLRAAIDQLGLTDGKITIG